jgi:hypothetical protein
MGLGQWTFQTEFLIRFLDRNLSGALFGFEVLPRAEATQACFFQCEYGLSF